MLPSASSNQSAVIGTLRVGTGRVEWGPATDPSQFSLTCDAANPCRLVLELQTTSGVVIDASQQITFADAEATASCGGAADGVLGIVMPADKTVLDNSWGAVITWNDSGYVTDDDAATANYDKVLDDIRAGEADDNAERQKQGYPGMHIVGWAQPPSYDKAQHSLIWARDFKIDGASADSLNYDVRVLGRKGVLSMNMLWDMPHLPEVRAAAADFGKVATFNAGSTYGEFNSSTDKAAGYGLAGLVAAGVGVAVAKKLGLLAVLLLFLKKGFVLLLVPLAAGWKRIKRLFGRGGDDDGGQAGVA